MCLGPTDVIDSEHPLIVAAAQAAIAGAPDGAAKRAALFRLVRDRIRYDLAPDLPDRTAWTASRTLARGTGFCHQKAVLLVALLRAARLPAAIGFEHIRDHKLLEPRFEKVLPGGIIAYHGRAAVFAGDRWLWIDPSLDSGLCEAKGYVIVEHDGLSEALLPKKDRAGQPHFDSLGTFGPFADVPAVVTDLLVSVADVWRELRTMVKKSGASM